jgi:hypothetical protein
MKTFIAIAWLALVIPVVLLLEALADWILGGP